jgi:hypothetical protein
MSKSCLSHDIHLTQSRFQGPVNSIVIKLRDITGIERSGTRPYCLVIETSLHKRYFFSFTSDEELYNWQDAIYSRSRLGGISNPANFVHNIHIGIDEVSGALTVSIGILTIVLVLMGTPTTGCARSMETDSIRYSMIHATM